MGRDQNKFGLHVNNQNQFYSSHPQKHYNPHTDLVIDGGATINLIGNKNLLQSPKLDIHPVSVMTAGTETLRSESTGHLPLPLNSKARLAMRWSQETVAHSE